MAEAAHRCGVVALLGRPGAGKSMLLNRLLGEELSIVSGKPQTTRSRLLGIWSGEGAQLLFVDTPGRRSGGKRLAAALGALAEEAAADCDVAVLLVDPREPWGEDLADWLARLAAAGTPVVLAASKQDLASARAAPWPPPGSEAAAACLRLSARSGEGVDALLEALRARVPAGPPLYPADQLSDRPLRFLAAEQVREAAFRELEQELPYELAVEVVEFDERRPDLVRVRAHLLVERASQRQIAIGSEGAMIKKIGIRARHGLERLLGKKVYLDLRVKLEPRWSRSPKRLKSLGYS
jgi:GTP-binding protein Era